MTISTNYAAGRLTIGLCGELDQHEAPGAGRAITELLDDYLPRECVLDLSSLSFMDSSGIAVFIKANRHVRRNGGRLRLENPCVQVQRVIDAAGLERMIPVDGGKIGGFT